MVPKLKKLSYEQRLEYLGLWTVEERRNRADLLEVFKMHKASSSTPFNDFFVLQTTTCTRGHTAKLAKNRWRLDLRQHFFSKSVIWSWNSLEQCVMTLLLLAHSRMVYGERETSRWASSWTNLSAWPYWPHRILEILLRNRCGRIWSQGEWVDY